ncbi:MAG: hypothetical protein CFE43_18795 [Burkholderiales bacterium PBB3]|nr:MAG: hypothetical protein CFE43_18795 [Burkholderiales bacterium PBB3]
MTNVARIGGESGDAANAAAGGGAAPVALQDKLARCQRQLGDWEACASSKTPEGQKIIQNLRAQIGNIESRIQAQSAQRSADAPPAPASPAKLTSLSMEGSLLSVFA